MSQRVDLAPLGVELRTDIEVRDRAKPFRARVRWIDPATKKRPSVSESFGTREDAEAWLDRVRQAAARGLDPKMATATLAVYGAANLERALRGVEPKTRDPYLAGWHRRLVPTVGHLPVTMITAGVADRAVDAWIAQGCGRSTVKNTLAMWVRVMAVAVRDELIDRNPVKVTGWQSQFAQYEDELEDPRSLALPDWQALTTLADSLVAASAGEYRGWGRCRALRSVHRDTDRRSLRLPCRRHRYQQLGVDAASANHSGTRWDAGQGYKGQARARFRSSRSCARSCRNRSPPSRLTRPPACSSVRVAAESRPECCGGRRIGTRWSRNWDSNTCADTTSATPDSHGSRTQGYRCIGSRKSRGTPIHGSPSGTCIPTWRR
ncbi:hypothetical protein APR12_000777 [Nocardia amikacinitolerans]|nr:hypothetical protein [Nocardia amikacinitolerans]